MVMIYAINHTHMTFNCVCVPECALEFASECACEYAKSPGTCRNLRLLIEMFSNILTVNCFFLRSSSISLARKFFLLFVFCLCFVVVLVVFLDCRFLHFRFADYLMNYLCDCDSQISSSCAAPAKCFA